MCKARAYGARTWLANQQDPGAYGAPGVVERSGVKGTTVVTVTVPPSYSRAPASVYYASRGSGMSGNLSWNAATAALSFKFKAGSQVNSLYPVHFT